MRRPALSFAGILLTLLALSACGGNDGEEPPPTSTPEATATTTSSTDDTTALPTSVIGVQDGNIEGTEFGRDPIDRPGTTTGTATLVLVREGQAESRDRLVFQFDGGLPGYQVQYIDQPVACGSGEPIDIEGAAFLQVRFSPAAAHDEAGNPTLDAMEIAAGLPAILEAELTCDFEADVIWVIGLPEQVDFRAFSLSEAFIVVDVMHP
jgi:hypothetical protein